MASIHSGIAWVCLWAAAGGAHAAGPGEGFPCVGTIQPRHARQIRASNWSVGAETMGRDYTIYAHWRKHLGPLGVKKARIQSGWAKTERRKGVYDWTWLDEIIPDMAAQGVEPWVCLCYGNPVYPGGGGTGLSGGPPTSDEALRAWERFVAAFVDRYKKHVDEWEIWNEANHRKQASPAGYADFLIRTAEVVRSRQPEARIVGLANAGVAIEFTRGVLARLRQRGRLPLLDEVTYHPYAANPDSVYRNVLRLRKAVHSFSKRIRIRQGENGCPSRKAGFGALGHVAWSEKSQAKWALRRLLGDLGRDVPSSYFAICDMAYRVRPNGRDSDWRDDAGKLRVRVNYKGLLAIHPDRTVHHVKAAYRAVQHVTAVFDDTLQRIASYSWRAEPGEALAVFAYAKPTGKQVVTVWRTNARPSDADAPRPTTFIFAEGKFTRPVYADMLTGKVYDVPHANWTRDGRKHTFRGIPVPDYPILLADRGAIPLRKTRGTLRAER
jgi:hypothetical protein